MASSGFLSKSDVQKLLTDPSPEARATTAAKLGTVFNEEDLSSSEKGIAEDIFRALIKDVEVRVRQALSENLKANPNIPTDVAKSLASDVADVALPILTESTALSDEDLIDIVRNHSAEHQIAVAKRETVSASVSDALARTENEDVVAVLVANEGADISEETFGFVMDTFGENEKINTPMAKRSKLPVRVAERLVHLVSESLRDHIVTHHEVSPEVASDLVLASRERATIGLVSGGGDTMDVIELVDQLHKNGRLTDTIIIRAICMGDLIFFETAVARRAGIPVSNAYQLIHDKGDVAMKRLFDKAGISDSLATIARIGINTVEELVTTAGDDMTHYRNLVIERVLTHMEEDIDPDNFDYLIDRLAKEDRTQAA